MEGRLPNNFAWKRGIWHGSKPSPFMRLIESAETYEEMVREWKAAEPFADIARELELERCAVELSVGG